MLQYTTIQHAFRKHYGLTLNEYILADMIYHLSHPAKSSIAGWCYMTKERMAEEIGLSKVSVMTLLKKLIEMGFIIKDEDTKFLQTTAKWNAVYDLTIGKETLPILVKKVYRGGKETLPNNYNNNNDNLVIKKKEIKINKTNDLTNIFEKKSNDVIPVAKELDHHNDIFRGLYVNQSWLESIAMKYKSEIKDVQNHLNKFRQDLILKGEYKGSEKDAKTHFINWINKGNKIERTISSKFDSYYE
jgi:hypothetical protein